MNNEIKKVFPFWEINEKGLPKILNAKLLGFIESQGFAIARTSETDHILVRMRDNRMSMATEVQVDQIIKSSLLDKNELKVFEVYVRGMGSFVSPRKFNLLKSVELVNDRDTYDSSNFFFKNCICKVTKSGLTIENYENLELPIWENRILKQSYYNPNNGTMGQFEKFCRNITGGSDVRFHGLKTILGYLLHRNKERGEAKVIILYDEKMGQNNQAHGGTGKTLLSQALAKCREVELFNGKEIKAGSWFNNQRVQLTTDVIVYDDLNKEISLEYFYSMITQGIEVEKKRKDAFYIELEDSPKIMISSNYPVKGPGGSSDIRRRHEFELSNYYDASFTPEMEFGNRFFGNAWGQEEWSKFFYFMMTCEQQYLLHGLVEVEPINLNKAKLIDASCQEFVEFANKYVEFNEWQDKRVFETLFQELHPEIEVRSPHIFRKWLWSFAKTNSALFDQKSSGGNYLFRIKKEVKNV